MSNHTTIIGNVTRDPELKFLGSGLAAVRFSVAVNRKSYKEGTPDKVAYFTVTALGSLAENSADTLKKGNRVIVSGYIEQRTWEKEDGKKGEAWELNADGIGVELRFNTANIQDSPFKSEKGAPVASPNYEDAF